jgi:hypothetical protein
VFEAGEDDLSVGRNFLEFGEWWEAGEANNWLAIDDLRFDLFDSTAFDVFSARFRRQRFECARYASFVTALAWRFVVLALEAAALAVGFTTGSTLYVLPRIQDRRCGFTVVPVVADTRASYIFGRPSNARYLEVAALEARKIDVTLVEIGAVSLFSLTFDAARLLGRRNNHLTSLIILKA